jgi:acyl carrier protein
MPEGIEKELTDFVVETFLFGEGGDRVKADTSLLDQGIIDSTGVLQIVAFLESTYGLQVGDDELVRDNFDSLSKLTAFVKKKLGS